MLESGAICSFFRLRPPVILAKNGEALTLSLPNTCPGPVFPGSQHQPQNKSAKATATTGRANSPATARGQQGQSRGGRERMPQTLPHPGSSASPQRTESHRLPGVRHSFLNISTEVSPQNDFCDCAPRARRSCILERKKHPQPRLLGAGRGWDRCAPGDSIINSSTETKRVKFQRSPYVPQASPLPRIRKKVPAPVVNPGRKPAGKGSAGRRGNNSKLWHHRLL